MARRRLESREDFVRALRNGRGLGQRESYKSWIGVRDVPSSGRSSRIHGITVKREYETLSDLETRTFYSLEWKKNVVDIREQFPILPRDLAIGIAERHGIHYPNVPRTSEPAILSTDFLATAIVGGKETFFPVDCKYLSELLDQRELAKLEIKRLFWASLGYKQTLVTEKQIDPVVSENLAFFSSPLRGELAPTFNCRNLNQLIEAIAPRTYTIQSLTELISKEEGVDDIVGRHLLFDLIWRQALKIDMSVDVQATGMISVEGWAPDAFQLVDTEVNASSA